MLQKIKSILSKNSSKQVGIYTFAGSLSKLISFAALPFFVNKLSAGDIGILNIFSNCIVFLTPIISMGVLYTFSVDYFKLPKVEYAKKISTGLIIPAALSLLLIPVLFLFKVPLAKAFNFQPAFLWLIPICLFLNFCFEAFTILMRNQNKVKLFAVVSIVKVVAEIGLSILFILFIYQSWYSRALAYLLSGLVIAGLFFLYLRKQQFLVNRVETKVLLRELHFGISGMVLQTAIFFINSSDKFFVMSFFGKDQAGYYAVASTFAGIQYIVAISLLQYLQPVLFSRFVDGDKWNDVKFLFYKYFLAMAATMLAVGAVTFIVYSYLLRPSYLSYLSYFYILAVNTFLWTIANLFLQYIVFIKNKKILVQLSVLSIAVAFGINYIASKYYAITYLAWGQVLIDLIVIAIIIFYNKKLLFFTSNEKDF